MIINHNLAGMNAIRNMNANSVSASKAMQKLSTGLRINSAADDAAGLAISEKMRGQIRGLDQASANAQDGISMIQTAEGGLSETHSILQRMRELAVQSSNGTATDADRTEIQKEVVQLKSEIDRISNDTEFNTKKLLNGKMAAAKAAQGTKANSVAFERGAVVATAGNVDGAIASNVSTKAADAGQKGSIEAGTVFDTTNGATIITGMNDQIKITVGSNASGNNSSTLTLAGDTAANGGKNYATLDAMISHLNSLVDANATLKGKVEFTKDAAGTKLVVKATTVGENVSVSEATAGQGALGALGLGTTTSVTAGAATFTEGAGVDLTGTASKSKFSITIGGVTKDIDLGSATDNGGAGLAVTDTNTTNAELNTALNQHINYAFFGNAAGTKIVVSGADTQVRTLTLDPTISSDIKNISISDKDNTQTGAATLFGALTATSVTATNSLTYGRDAVAAATIGNVIVAGANDKFNISVDGGTAQTLTLTAKTYADRASLVDEINNQINSNINLKDKVTASLDTDNTIKFISASTGTSSGVVVSAPGTAAESALAALGYKGNTQTSIVGGTYDGDFSTAANAKFEMTVGNLTKTIDFSTASGINSNTSIANAKDAIQTKIDEAFGENVVKVDIANNKLKFTNTAATDTFAIKDSSISAAASELGATKLLGNTSSNGVITNNVNISALGAATRTFGMTVGGVSKVVSVTNAAATQASVVAGLQTGLDNAWGTGVFSVKASGATGFTLESTLNNTSVKILADVAANTGNAALFNAGNTAIQFTRMANDSLTLNNVTVDGTASSLAGNVQATTKLVNLTDTDGSNLGLSAGNVITIAGTKDGAGFSSTLAVTATTTMAELVDKMNGMSAFSGGTVSLNDQTGKIEFTGANGKVNDISNLKLSAQISATDTTTINSFNNKAGSFIKTQTAQDASSGNQTTVHIGSNEGQTTTLDINDMSVKALSLDKVDVSTKDGAEVAITLIDNSITNVSSERSKLGALQNRLEHTIANLGTSSENLTSAESRIRDVDMAKEMSTFSKNNILAQAAQAMLAQANQQPQQVLQLLR